MSGFGVIQADLKCHLNPVAERRYLIGTTSACRAMLRYAIEKFPEPERLSYIKGTA